MKPATLHQLHAIAQGLQSEDEQTVCAAVRAYLNLTPQEQIIVDDGAARKD